MEANGISSPVAAPLDRLLSSLVAPIAVVIVAVCKRKSGHRQRDRKPPGSRFAF